MAEAARRLRLSRLLPSASHRTTLIQDPMDVVNGAEPGPQLDYQVC